MALGGQAGRQADSRLTLPLTDPTAIPSYPPLTPPTLAPPLRGPGHAMKANATFGGLRLPDLYYDRIHPSNYGHTLLAHGLIHVLKRANLMLEQVGLPDAPPHQQLVDLGATRSPSAGPSRAMAFDSPTLPRCIRPTARRLPPPMLPKCVPMCVCIHCVCCIWPPLAWPGTLALLHCGPPVTWRTYDRLMISLPSLSLLFCL